MNDTQPTRQEREAQVARMIAEARRQYIMPSRFETEEVWAARILATASAPGEHWLEQSRLATEAYAHFQGAVRAELDRIGLPIHAADGHRMMELERLALLGAPGEQGEPDGWYLYWRGRAEHAEAQIRALASPTDPRERERTIEECAQIAEHFQPSPASEVWDWPRQIAAGIRSLYITTPRETNDE